mmetsp:Transcript_44445/g.126840  ORF Transcript_44445/g.126840 Transcript_44445/m.126840 type:complete len:245 (-) Transcript_44445:43-777(-)
MACRRPTAGALAATMLALGVSQSQAWAVGPALPARAQPPARPAPARRAGFCGAPDGGLRLAAGASAGIAALVLCRAKRQLSWYVKQRQNAEYAKRNPPPLLTKRELRKRVTKVKLLRRSDVWATEFFCYVDPREEKYQFSVQEVKQIQENPEFVPEEREREALGIPMPPIRMTESALNKMRGERVKVQESARKGAAQEEGDEGKKKRKEKKTVDLSGIDADFISWKGIELSKKQQARMAQKKKR